CARSLYYYGSTSFDYW
nr:immunoglobulin heavy chain junction region [Mus musculus]MBK4185937.1 immunoglobulin heavy chain junction region [Mus musculus]MBK4185938.1 immunoglobulin heavy chain junction region [Mus musculus]MBK4185939.1 immunoglobulin heavy chain junction region [Mus musculus]MBK4185940.1 immunoglobulin heavy chain junction region [Mus musculus]